jgi:hypothetical protein
MHALRTEMQQGVGKERGYVQMAGDVNQATGPAVRTSICIVSERL